VRKFGDAAKRAKIAGFDAIQILAAHGYLIHNFLLPLTNLRTDQYGGSIEGRSRFLLEILEDIREKTGPDFPLLVRLSGTDGIPGGCELQYMQEVARLVEQAGADLIDISAGTYNSLEWTIQPHQFQEGCLVEFADYI
jgi:2,4-dienoyl-CoA reductase-like NADH-dependent reductase (Old Yellow Enzyme family)